MTPGPDGAPQDKIIVHGDPDLRELIPGFLENRRKDLAALSAAVERGDFPAIQALGHRIKGDGAGGAGPEPRSRPRQGRRAGLVPESRGSDL
jgi:hypothetical protein